MRNGLAGLAGATEALGRAPVAEKDALRSAVVAELTRLGALLGGPAGAPVPRVPRTGGYLPHAVVRNVVLLWGATGMRIELDADPDAVVSGCPDTLAQVLTNVIANCARHAPGSAVRVRVTRSGQRVRIRVSDSGPGLGALSERAAFERRVCGEGSPGQGLGLYVCRELLARDGGTTRILPAAPDRTGCTIELPAASPERLRRTSRVAVPSEGALASSVPSPDAGPVGGAMPSAV